MEVTIYGSRVSIGDVVGLAMSFEPWPLHERIANARGESIESRPEDRWQVIVPEGSRLEMSSPGKLLVWRFGSVDVKSMPHTVHALAGLGLHGFRFKEG